MGIPIRCHDCGTEAGEQAGEGSDGGAGVGLHTVPQQDQGLRRVAENVGPTPWGIFEGLHCDCVPRFGPLNLEAAEPYGELVTAVAGKVVAITGGARGIGLATATVLHGLGARVAIGDIDESAVDDAGGRLGLQVHRRLDVTDRQSFGEFLDAVEDAVGPIDVLVNNAGVIAVGSAIDEDDAVTRRLLDVNIFGVMLGTKLAAQRMLARGRGHVINIASLGGVLPTEGIATYCATKHAVLGYTNTVRMENRGRGVHFSAIMPTLTNTEMIAGIGRATGFKNAEPEDVARAVASVIAKPRPQVVVPRSMGIVASAQRLMPQGVAEALGRALGTGRVFTSDVEVDKRTSYARRTGTS
jgi:short-subunit dehydrogenase